MFVTSTAGYHYNVAYLRMAFVADPNKRVQRVPISPEGGESNSDTHWAVQAFFGESHVPVDLFVTDVPEEAQAWLDQLITAAGGIFSPNKNLALEVS